METGHDDEPLSPAGSHRLRFDRVEMGGAFGDLGTLLPIVVAMISVITESVTGASGIIFSALLLVLSLSGMIDHIDRLFSPAVVRGIQFTASGPEPAVRQ